MIRNVLALLMGVAVPVFLARGVDAQDILYTERHEFTIGEDHSFRERADVEVRFLSTRSTDIDAFHIGEQYFARVKNLQGSFDGKRLRGDAFQTFTPEREDIFLSGGKVHRIDLPQTPSSGSVATYSYERDYLDAAYAPVLRIPDLNRVAAYDIVVNHPEGVTVDFKMFVPRGEVEHSISSTGGRTAITFRNLEPLNDLPLFAHNGAHAYVLLDLRRDGDPLTPTAPDEFASWYAALVNTPAPPPTILPIAEGLRGETDSATVASMHDYVRESIRYIADERDAGAFVPRAPDLVVERAYGDCKDRAFLISALAQSLGLRVDPVLITTAPEPEFEEVHIGLFNHVICSFTHDDGTRTYFDPTDPYSSFGDLPESDVDGHALRIGPDGAERLYVQAQSTRPTLDLDVSLDLDAPAEADAVVTVRGEMLSMMRAIEARQTEQDARNALSAVAGRLLYKVRLSGIQEITRAARERTYRARADFSEFVIASPTKRYLPLTPFRAIAAEASERRDDALTVYTEDRPNVRLSLSVDGAAWQPDAREETIGDPEGAVWFTAEAVPGSDAAQITYQFGQRTRRFTGDDRTAFMSLADAYLGARRDVITFRSPTDE